MERTYVGTAGWSITRAAAPRFDADGSHLERYSRRFRCVEINSSFYRPHASKTYERWRRSTPPGFRFAVKVPRTITHELKLKQTRPSLLEFLDQTGALEEKRGPLLVQLPPSLQFDAGVAHEFFGTVRTAFDGAVVLEPRHSTWFSADVSLLLAFHRISRVVADPPPIQKAIDRPHCEAGTAYFRLHGSPRMYWSRYDLDYLRGLARTVRESRATEVWCVFDNTASGAAIENALELQDLLGG
jgi:uncharacterized protein YecE (DUF72 family)